MDALQRLLIEDACRTLVLRAAACADAGDAESLAALFADDAVLVRPNRPPVNGREAIRAVYAERPAQRLTRHLVTNTLVDIDSVDSTRARSLVLLWSGSSADPETPQGRRANSPQMVGEFNDRLVRTAAGWRIAERTARFVLHSGEAPS